MIAFMVFSVLFGGLTFKIIAVGGIEAVLADLMASTCTNNTAIPCDYQALLGAAGMALVIVTSWFIYFIRVIGSAEEEFNTEDKEPSRAYNDDMADILADIQNLGGVENLKALAEWKGIPYTTLRRYVKRFEIDGYVMVISNGKGSPVVVEVLP
jgi:Na+-transporting methylmalonyl-CoA/oxaloacetate decarboxylase gamma subunit